MELVSDTNSSSILPAGFEVRGGEFRKGGHIKVIISGVRTGTRSRKDEKVSVK